MQVPLCTTKNGVPVTYDPIDSHTATHLADTPELKELVVEVLTNLECTEDRMEFDVDMQRIIGTTDVVAIDETDELVYAVRKNRDDDEYVPFTKSRPAEPCSWISIALLKREVSYELMSTWIGRFDSPPFPGTKYATAESVLYWSKLAFVWGSQEIKPGTQTATRPW